MDTYGIETDFSEAKYRLIEINKTILLNGDFKEYQRPLRLMMHLLPAGLRLRTEHDCSTNKSSHSKNGQGGIITETYMRTSGKKGLTVKIYDKRKELQAVCSVKVNYNYLRFEITLKSPKKIRECFGTDLVSELTDEKINDYFNNFLIKNVLVPWERHCTDRNKEIKRILKANYAPASHKWIRNSLLEIASNEIASGVPLLLDVEELLPVLNNIKFTNKRVRGNAKSTFRSLCNKKIRVFGNHDDEKYKEVLDKLLRTSNNGFKMN